MTQPEQLTAAIQSDLGILAPGVDMVRLATIRLQVLAARQMAERVILLTNIPYKAARRMVEVSGLEPVMTVATAI